MISNLFKTEILKTRKFKMLWFAIALPAILPLFTLFVNVNEDPEVFKANMVRAGEKKPYYFLSSMTYFLFSIFVPMIAAMVTISLNYLERQANGWKYLVMSPVSTTQLMLVKIFVSMLYMLAAVFLFYSFHMIFGFIFSWVRPDLNINPTSEDHIYFFLLYMRIAFSSFGVLCIFWAISLASKSYIIISVFLSVFGIMIPGRFSPFRLAGETFSIIGKHRNYLNKENLPVRNFDLLTLSYIDIVSLGWMILGFALIVVFFKSLTKKLI